MKITKSNNVLIEKTTRFNGMLVQGGVIGRVTSYPLAGVIKATGLTREQIAAAEPTDYAPAYGDGASIAYVCAIEMLGKIIRKGKTIQ